MGQKVSPHGLRVGIIKDWDSKWYADKKHFSDYLIEDSKIRKYVKKQMYTAGISRILIERSANRVKLTINTAKPGMVIGKGGSGVEALRKELEKMTQKRIVVNVEEVKRPDQDAQLVAESIAQSLERRVSFRRAMKQAITKAQRAGAKGIKTQVAGRLGGADIDYGFAEADTTYGKIGVKVWIYKGEILPGKKVRPVNKRKAVK